MGDLMTDTCSMSDLQSKYGNFLVPDFRIKVDGSQVQRSGKNGNALIDNVRIKLSTDAAGSLEFSVLNAYDIQSRSFDSGIKGKFKPGKTITAEIGYAGNLTAIFKGYIHSVTYEYSDVPAISVTALDVIRLMQDNEVLSRTFDNVNATDAFKKVMEFYQKLCPSGDVKADPSSSQKEQITQKETDYTFVKETLCAMEGREFFVLDGKAYFMDVDKSKSSVIDLEWGKDILSFSYQQQYLDREIQVNAVDKKKKMSGFLYKKKASGGSQKTVLSSPTVKNISMSSTATEAEAKVQAKKTVKDLKKERLSCSGSCIGIPNIVPGRSLTLKKLDGDLNGTYEIVSVEHSIGSDGYVTNFELGGKV